MGDDFNIDKGVNVDEVINFEDEEVLQEPPEVNKGDYKRTAIITAAIGFLIVVVAFGVMNLIGSRQHKVQEAPMKIEEQSGGGEGSAYVQKVEPGGLQVNKENPVAGQAESALTTQWEEISTDSGVEFNKELEGTFTVTSVRHYAKVAVSNKEVVLKSVVTGSISGLSGTYEIEIPYMKARYLKIGDTFEVKYHCSVEEGVMFIGEIEY